MRVVLTGEKPSDLEGVRRLIQGMGLDCSGADCIAYEHLSHRLAQSPAPGLVLVYTGKDANAALQSVQQAATTSGAPVLAVAPPDIELKKMLEDKGAQIVVEPEHLRDGLSEVVEQVNNENRGGTRGKVYGVFSAHPGCGVTTVATGLAFSLAAAHPAKAALIEAGYTVPELALDLDLKVQHSFSELVRNWERMDAFMLRQVALAHPAGLNVLAYSSDTIAPVVVEPKVLQRMLALARSLYEASVLDLGHGLPAVTRSAIPLMEQAFIVFRPEVPSLRMTHNLIRQLRDAELPMDRFRLVANRTGWRQQVDVKEVEKVLRMPVQEWVPDDPATVIAALNLGKPLIQYSPRAKITRSIDRLAQSLLSRK